MTGKIHILPDQQTLNTEVAQAWLELSTTAIAEHGAFHVALSGGTTPKSLFRLLASSEWCQRFDWQNTHIYFGDERCVPADHPDSNYRMAREAMLESLSIPDSNIHPIEVEPEDFYASAQAYQQVLLSSLPKAVNGVPQFDLMLQGMGDDGHTASLFPGTDILQQRNKWTDAVYVTKLDAWRISVTFPVIDNARCVFMLVCGAGKAKIIQEVLTQPASNTPYPVQLMQPKGELHWYLDGEAARLLPADINGLQQSS